MNYNYQNIKEQTYNMDVFERELWLKEKINYYLDKERRGDMKTPIDNQSLMALLKEYYILNN